MARTSLDCRDNHQSVSLSDRQLRLKSEGQYQQKGKAVLDFQLPTLWQEQVWGVVLAPAFGSGENSLGGRQGHHGISHPRNIRYPLRSAYRCCLVNRSASF